METHYKAKHFKRRHVSVLHIMLAIAIVLMCVCFNLPNVVGCENEIKNIECTQKEILHSGTRRTISKNFSSSKENDDVTEPISELEYKSENISEVSEDTEQSTQNADEKIVSEEDTLIKISDVLSEDNINVNENTEVKTIDITSDVVTNDQEFKSSKLSEDHSCIDWNTLEMIPPIYENTDITGAYFGDIELLYEEPYNICDDPLTAYMGVKWFNDHEETYYSQRVLPGGALNIPGRHVADDGTVRDEDGYICVASDLYYLDRGSTVLTSLGPGKVYDTGCAYGVIDIYVDW